MPMVPFYTRFRDLAFKEMRSVTVLEDRDGLPAGTYGFLESYCDERGCDCRSVFLNVVTPDMKAEDGVLATINFGWEKLDYYVKWMHGAREFAREMKGPSLSSAMMEQSELAPALLELFNRALLTDEAYVQRLKRHYRMFRQAVEREELRPEDRQEPPSRQAAPNDPCPCGSGRKYKRCCGASGAPAAAPGGEELVRRRLREYERPEHQERPPGEYVARLQREVQKAGAHLARLAAYESEARVQQKAQLLLFVGCREPGLDADVREAITRAAGPVLRSAMQDPAVGDDRKYHLGPLLGACGIRLSDRAYRKCFRNYEETATRKNSEYMKQLSADPENLERALVEAGLVAIGVAARPSKRDLDNAFVFGGTVIEHNPDAGGVLLPAVAAIAAEHGMGFPEAESALRVARAMGGSRSAWALGELGSWPGLGPLGEKAAELAREMAAEGIRPRAPYAGTFSHAWATHVDGSGSRNLFVHLRTPEGTMDALVFMPNDGTGIKDL
jgi:hypothetical protein